MMSLNVYRYLRAYSLADDRCVQEVPLSNITIADIERIMQENGAPFYDCYRVVDEMLSSFQLFAKESLATTPGTAWYLECENCDRDPSRLV